MLVWVFFFVFFLSCGKSCDWTDRLQNKSGVCLCVKRAHDHCHITILTLAPISFQLVQCNLLFFSFFAPVEKKLMLQRDPRVSVQEAVCSRIMCSKCGHTEPKVLGCSIDFEDCLSSSSSSSEALRLFSPELPNRTDRPVRGGLLLWCQHFA